MFYWVMQKNVVRIQHVLKNYISGAVYLRSSFKKIDNTHLIMQNTNYTNM